MANGPFQSYAPPGPYSDVEVQGDNTAPPAGNQIPVLVGTGRETLRTTDFEVVRGSSSRVDQRIVNEDVDDRFVVDDTNPDNPTLGSIDGSSREFRVENYPIVSGNGQGEITNDPSDVTITKNDELVTATSLDGEKGIVTLEIPPLQGDEIRVTYHFNRTDTEATDDVSEQVSDNKAVIFSDKNQPYSITSGDNDEVNLRVDGTKYNVTLTSGSRSAQDIAADFDIAVLTVSQDVDNQGNTRVKFESSGEIEILEGSANNVLGLSSGDVTDRNVEFYTYNSPIVTGSNGGITTTNTSDVTAKVNGSEVTVESVDGGNGLVTLADPPVVGATVEITYHFNTFQDTFDYLPNTGVESVERVGISPGRTDYIEGIDYVVDPNGKLLWGSSKTIESGVHTSGYDFFDDTQITANLHDMRKYMEEVERYLDRDVTPPQKSDRTVVLGDVPTQGNGRDKVTDNPSDVSIYHGTSVNDALDRGAQTITNINPDQRRVTVEHPIPTDHKVFATYYYNRLGDEEFTLTVENASNEKIKVEDENGNNRYNVRFGQSPASDTVRWPSGTEDEPDAFVGTNAVNETVTVTFTQVNEEAASLTSLASGPYDIFSGQSDHFGATLDDGDNGVTSQNVDIDLDTAAFAALVSDNLGGASYSVTTGENDKFEWQIDDTSYSVTIPSGSYTVSELAEYIWRQPANETEVQGTAQDAANGGIDFSLTSSTTYDLTINGVNVTQSDQTIDGTGSPYDASTAATKVADALKSAMDTAGPSTYNYGDITDPANDFNVVANNDGTLSIVASESLSIADTSNAGDELEAELGWDGGDVPNDDNVGSYSTGTTLENTKVARTWEGNSAEYILLRSRTTPSLRSDTSSVRVLSANANDLLGFDDYEEAKGTTTATNKGASVYSSAISSSDRTTLEAEELDFVVTIDGTEYTVNGSDFDTDSTLSDFQTTIDNVIGSVATVSVENTDHLRITSNSVDSGSSVEIGDGAANQYLGFEEGDRDTQNKAKVEEIVSVLNNSSTGWSDNSAGSVDLQGLATTSDFTQAAYGKKITQSGAGNFLQVKSFGVGTDAIITLRQVTDSVYNDTGIGLEAGDSDTGVDGEDGFTVSSSNSNGSSGKGVVGQTYTDSTTGLTFTVLSPQDGDYSTSETFTLIVEKEQTVGSTVLNRSIPGLETFISSVSQINEGDTSIVTTYSSDGDEPDIGDFYYITYNYLKDDFSAKVHNRFSEVRQEYGDLDPSNPLTLGAYLTFLNGAVIVAAKQVKKAAGSDQASSQAYIDALSDLKKTLSGGRKPDILVPLTSDTDVMASYVNHAEIQSSKRFRQERRCIFGVASGTRPETAGEIANSLNSKRSILVYPDSAIITLSNELNQEEEYIISGTYVAAALAGSMVSPAFDVATPLTNRRVVGFSRLNRSLDEEEKDNLAVNGVTILEDTGSFLEVRDGLTTDMSSIVTQVPSIVAISDFVRKRSRDTLKRFIGLKFLENRVQDVELALTGLLNSLVEQEIIVDFKGVSAQPAPNDPTSLRVQAFFSPVYPLKYINISFTLGSRNSF